MRKAFFSMILALLMTILFPGGSDAADTMLPLEDCTGMAGINQSLYIFYGFGGWNMARYDASAAVEELGLGTGCPIGGQYEGAMWLSDGKVRQLGENEGQALSIPSELSSDWIDCCVRVEDTLFIMGVSQNQNCLTRLSLTDGKGARVEGCKPQCIAAGDKAVYVIQLAGRGEDSLYQLVAYDVQGRELETLASIDVSDVYGLAWDAETGDLYWMEGSTLFRWRDGQKSIARTLPADSMTTGAAAFQAGQYALLHRDGRIRLYDVETAAQQTVLTIRGVMQEGIPVDGAFMLAHPDISIERTTQGHLCAEEIYTAMLSGESDTDIFLVQWSEGISQLMEKGYLAALEDDEALWTDAQELYPAFQQVVMANGRLYAVIEAAQVRGWAISADMAEEMEAPASFAELLDALEEWEDSELNDGRAFLWDSVYGDWTAVDLAAYALEQFIFEQASNQDISFVDNGLMALLERIRGLADSGLAPVSGSVDSGQGVLIAPRPGARVSNSVKVLGINWGNQHIIAAPSVMDGDLGRVRTAATIYVVNPLSPHQQQAKEFLAYVAANRHQQYDGCLYEHIVPTMYDQSVERLSELQSEEEEAAQALAEAQEEERLALQQRIETLRIQQQATLNRPDQWVYYEPALTAYRQAVVPGLFTTPCRLMELDQQTHAPVWDELVKTVQQYMEGFTSLDQCVQRLSQIARALALEE